MISSILYQPTFGCICTQKIPRLLNIEKEELFQPPWPSYDTFTINSLNHCTCILITLSSAELVISFNTHPPKHNHKVSWWTYQSGTENGTNSGQLPEPWTWLWGERFLQIGQQSIEPLPLHTAIWGLETGREDKVTHTHLDTCVHPPNPVCKCSCTHTNAHKHTHAPTHGHVYKHPH